jgi:phage-related protein
MPKNDFRRELIFYKEVFWDFYNVLDLKAQRKVEWILGLVRDLPIIPANYFKSIQGEIGLYEIRVQSGSMAFRIFCFMNNQRGIVLLNGFIKKTNRTPRREIDKAVKLKSDYINEKENRL